MRQRICFQFKGIPVEDYSLFTAYCMVDVYGLDAKDTVSLNRSEFTPKGKRRIRELHQQNQTVFCEIILQKFQDEQFDPDKAFGPGGALKLRSVRILAGMYLTTAAAYSPNGG